MIKSKYIFDIIDLLLDGDEEGIMARRQIEFLTEKEIIFTGPGAFIYFSNTEQIEKYKVKNIDLNITGVVINSPELKLGADAHIFLKNGIINYLEIYSRDSSYPKYELQEYIITQEWVGSPNRKIESTKKTSA